MNICCMIVDDEPLALDVLESFIKKIDYLELSARCENALDAFKQLQSTKIDLLFLDIEMPVMNGLELINSLSSKPKVIITTAYRNYAVEGFELDVCDYLVKPIPFQRFLKAVSKAFPLALLHGSDSKENDFSEEPGFLVIKSEKKFVRIALENILWIESLKDYINIKTTSGSFVTYQSINGILERLPSQKFVRIHKSIIVAIDKIDFIEGNYLEIKSQPLSIGRVFKEELLKKLLDNGINGIRG